MVSLVWFRNTTCDMPEKHDVDLLGPAMGMLISGAEKLKCMVTITKRKKVPSLVNLWME